MQQQVYIPWRDRAFVSIPECGIILARSTERVRAWLAGGRLDGRRLTTGGPLVVTVESLARFVDDAEPAPPAIIKAQKWPALRLVINNDIQK